MSESGRKEKKKEKNIQRRFARGKISLQHTYVIVPSQYHNITTTYGVYSVNLYILAESSPIALSELDQKRIFIGIS